MKKIIYIIIAGILLLFVSVCAWKMISEVSSSQDNSELSYTMDYYTTPPNSRSSVEIEYPVFTGKNSAKINKLVLKYVKKSGSLDLNLFPENPKMIKTEKSAVTLINSKIVSIVFWGHVDIEVSAFPTTYLHTINIDRQTLKEVPVSKLFRIDREFEKVFLEKAFYCADPVTSFDNEMNFYEYLELRRNNVAELTEDIYPASVWNISYIYDCFFKPDGVVFSVGMVHAADDHFEAELSYDDVRDFYLPKKIYWED